MALSTPESEIKYDPKKHNVYADRIDGTWLHISEAESGQKGYYCQGCGKELVAVKSKLPNRIHFFRHAAMDVLMERKCVYRDFDFRHKLAIELVARLKHVKAPAVYKYPPKGSDSIANLIKEAQLIEAHSVEIERAFYENEIGEIKWGSGQGVDEKYLLVRPDVTFFDSEKNPILFVELAASHKVDIEKKAKLRRLGINTIEIIVPKDSPEAIEAALYSAKNIKWIYNYEEDNTKYVPVSKGNTKGVPPIDEQQERLFSETFECRQAEIRNLVRSITRVLESQHYGNIVQQLGTEISRVEDNTRQHEARLEAIREGHRTTVAGKYAERRSSIIREAEAIRTAEEEFGAEEANLEKRYTSKKRELKNSEESIRKEQAIVERQLKGYTGEADGVGESVQHIKDNLERLVEEEESAIRRLEQELENAPGVYKSEEEGIIERFRNNSEHERSEIDRISIKIEALPGDFEKQGERIAKEFQTKERELEEEFRRQEEGLATEFEKNGKRAIEEYMSQDVEQLAKSNRRVQELLEASRILTDQEQAQRLLRRYKKAWRHFKEESYQNWHE